MIQNQKGFAHLVLILGLLVLVAGIGVTVYLTQFTQIFKPKAAVDPIIFQGTGVSKAADGSWKTTSLNGLSVKLTSPLITPKPTVDPLEGKQFGISQSGDYANLGMPYLMFFRYEFHQDTPIHTLMKCGYQGTPPPCANLSDPNNPKIDGDLEAFIRSHPHNYWTIFNEPELSANDPKWGITAEGFAKLWYEYYRRIKSADQTATVFFPGMGTNAPNYQTFIPTVLQAYRAIPNKQADMDGSMPVDLWTFHVYPSGIGCGDPTLYKNGIITTAYLGNQFLNLIKNQEGGIYAQTPVWITEWGWIRNHPGEPIPPAGGATKEIGNSTCVTQYIRDAVSLFKGNEVAGQKIQDASRIKKWFTFANSLPIATSHDVPGCKYEDGTACKVKPGWPDDDYNPSIIRDDTLTNRFRSTIDTMIDGAYRGSYIIRRDKINWYTWSGFLKDQQGNVTDPGRMYACLANHADPNDCPLPAPAGTITLSPASCTIPAGQTTCNVTVSWQANNADIASLYEYVSYKDGDQGVKKSAAVSGSYKIELPAGRHAFNLFKTAVAGGPSDLFDQKWITVTGGPTWSDNLLTSDLRTTTVTAAEAQKVQWFTGNDAVGTFKLTGSLSGDNSVIQVDIWSPENKFVSTHRANEGTFTNASPNRFAVILRNQGTGTTTFSNVSLVKQTNVLGVQTVSAQTTPYTKSFKISDSAGKVDSAPVQQYTSDGMVVPITFADQNPGKKFVFVEFIGSGGEKERATASITYTPPATVSPSPSSKPSQPPTSPQTPIPTVSVIKMEKSKFLQGSIPLYDAIFTTKQNEADNLTKQGYVNKGVVFKTPGAGTTGAVVAKRMAKEILLSGKNFVQVTTWATDASDISALKSQGFAEEANNDFFVFTSQQPNTVGITRLKIYSPEDNKTFYTFATSQTIINSLTNQGWQVDKANVFYVYP